MNNDYVLDRKKLRVLREKCGYTQRRLSELSGVTSQYICEMETGKGQGVKAQLSTVKALADAMGVDMYMLCSEVKATK